MTAKKKSYRINFTMPSVDNELNNKLRELFERHSELGNLRHWIIGLASDAAQFELDEQSGRPIQSRIPEAVKEVAQDDSAELQTLGSEPDTQEVLVPGGCEFCAEGVPMDDYCDYCSDRSKTTFGGTLPRTIFS